MRDVIEMARESWLDTYGLGKDHNSFVEALKRFADLVRADECEQIIALQQREDVLAPIGHSAWGEAYQEGWAEGTAAYRDAIRARDIK
jgi:hypothetical protein